MAKYSRSKRLDMYSNFLGEKNIWMQFRKIKVMLRLVQSEIKESVV